jgi:uncharacterized membrane protein YvlD (DUF360 family)
VPILQDVGGFWSALGGALIVSIVSWMLSAAMNEDRYQRKISCREG